MNAFEYAGPTSPELAVKAIGRSGAAFLSGGTDLLNRMKDYVATPSRVVYINDIKPLAGVHASGGAMSIGAATKLAAIVHDKTIEAHLPALHRATAEVGTPQLRHMATIGGNLLQRPRCWYYRNGFGLLGMKDGKSLVRTGDNRYHAIFLTDGDALFVNPSSIAAPLIALGAEATLLGPKGERTIAVEKLYQVPKSAADSELTIAADELLTKVTIPRIRGKNATYEIRQKRAYDWPIVLASAALELDGSKVTSAKIILAGVAPIPWRSEEAEAAIVGKELTTESAEAAGAAAVSKAKPLSMNAYKVTLAKVAVKRALLTIAGKKYWEEA
jgi:xanthine dehydrogenase YagS FAD-binding subunit